MATTGSRLTAGDLDGERRALASTLRLVGPEAPTMAGPWTARDLAAHLASTEQVWGVPTFVGRTLVRRFGWRLNDTLRPAMAVDLRRFRRRGFDQTIARLERPSPRLLARDAVLPLSVFEVFVHHEDVRRPNGVARTRRAPDLVPSLAWLLVYQQPLLADTSLHVHLPDGTELRSRGVGPTLTVAGSAEDVVLWVAGRREQASVTVTADAAAAAVVDRLRV